MNTVKVTALETHYGRYGKKRKGDVYEVTEKEAAQLVGAKLVSAKGVKGEKQEGEKILVSDKKKEKVEAPAPQPEKVETDGPSGPAVTGDPGPELNTKPSNGKPETKKPKTGK